LFQFKKKNKRERKRGEGKTMATAKGGGGQKDLLWRLPEVTSKELGKIGPAFGLGIGCGAGAGIGFFGGKTPLFSGSFPSLRVFLGR
jgi:large subunit ribosomal protein L37e